MVAKGVLVVFALCCGCFTATEVFAYLAHLAPVLGTPLYREGFIALYPPWEILRWAWWWARPIPEAFLLPGATGAGVTLLGLYAGWSDTHPGSEQARWATRREWKRAECLGTTGIVLGRWR